MKYTTFFSERVPNLPSPNDKGEVMVPCVFHKDSTPSLGINLESGKWKCFASHCPGHKGGGYKRFDALLRGEDHGNGAAPIQVQPIDESIIDGFHSVLLNTVSVRDMLRQVRGISDEVIAEFKLGWDSDRVWIPIRDTDGAIVNVRKWKPQAKRDKVIPFGPGYNRPRLFPQPITSEWVLLVEGEMDCLTARSLGLPAHTGTGGADTWPSEFTKELAGKRVVVCYDTDPSGKKGAAAVAARLAGKAAQVQVLTLPLSGTSDQKDLTDWVVKGKHTAAELLELVKAAPTVEPVAEEQPGPPSEAIDLHLSQVGEERFVGKRIRSTVLVAGKDLAPFQVPRKVAFSCVMGEKICSRCKLADAGGSKELTFPEWDPQLLQMVNVHQLTVDSVLNRACGIPQLCHKATYEVKEHANIEAIKAIPEIDFTSERSEYVIRQLFYLGHGLETNHTYDIEAVVMPDPKTQYATAIVYKAQSSKDNIEEFQLDTETLTLLNMFKVSP